MATLRLPQLLIDAVTAVAQAARPTLLNRDPGPAETDVPVDTPIAFDLVDVGTAGIDRTATQVFVDGALAFDGRTAAGIAPAFTGPGSASVIIPSSAVQWGDGRAGRLAERRSCVVTEIRPRGPSV